MAEAKGNFAVEITDGVGLITFTRPDRLNAFDRDAHLELGGILDKLSADPKVQVAVLTGEGRAFCAGADLKYSLETGDMFLPEQGFGSVTHRDDPTLTLIAAVNGLAMGGGFELALGCDMIIASTKCFFALPEPKIGMAAATGGVQMLTRAIGPKRAMAPIMTGRNITAEEGYRLGFVTEVAEPEKLLEAAMGYAREIAANAPLANAANKQTIYECWDQPDHATMMKQETYSRALPALLSEDAKEGIAAFLEKRKPNWQGK